jgi:tryptophan synthase alpha chain
MNLLEERFRARRHGFIPFIVAGDPDLETTADLITALSRLQPTAIEVGVPFSDPTADGVVIQRSSQRALRNGTNLTAIFKMLRKTHREGRAPIVLFGYYNPILQFGIDKFVRAARQASVAGVLVVDLPIEAATPLRRALQRHEIDLIFLVAPTTGSARLKKIGRLASGFIYAVSRTGVTGTERDLVDESRQLVRRIRAVSDLPIAVGFGISNGTRARTVCQYADAAVVGSRLVTEIDTASAKLGSNRATIVRSVMRCARQFVRTASPAQAAGL